MQLHTIVKEFQKDSDFQIRGVAMCSILLLTTFPLFNLKTPSDAKIL